MLNKKLIFLRGVLFLVLVFLIASVSAIPQTFTINRKLTDSSETALTAGNDLWSSRNLLVVSDLDGIYNLNAMNLNEYK